MEEQRVIGAGKVTGKFVVVNLALLLGTDGKFKTRSSRAVNFFLQSA